MAGYDNQLHVDQYLSSVSVAYSNEQQRVGDMVLPPVNADKISDAYPIYGTEQFKKLSDVREPGSNALEIKQSLTRGTYKAEEHAVKTVVPLTQQRDADDPPINPEVDNTIFLTEAELNQREFNQLAVVGDPTQVTQNTALSGTSLWSDYTNSVPLTNLRAARSAVRLGVHRPANTWLLSADVDYVLADHPAFKDLVKYTDPENLTEGGIPSSVRGLMVLVSQTDQDTTPYSGLQPFQAGFAAPAFQAAFYKAGLVFYRNPAGLGLRSVTFGVTFEAPDAMTGARGIQVRKWIDEDKKALKIEVSDTYAVKLIAPLAGYLFSPAIA